MNNIEQDTWESRFEEAFADMRTSGLWYKIVKEFVRQELATARASRKEEDARIAEREHIICTCRTSLDYDNWGKDEKRMYAHNFHIAKAIRGSKV